MGATAVQLHTLGLQLRDQLRAAEAGEVLATPAELAATVSVLFILGKWHERLVRCLHSSGQSPLAGLVDGLCFDLVLEMTWKNPVPLRQPKKLPVSPSAGLACST